MTVDFYTSDPIDDYYDDYIEDYDMEMMKKSDMETELDLTVDEIHDRLHSIRYGRYSHATSVGPGTVLSVPKLTKNVAISG